MEKYKLYKDKNGIFDHIINNKFVFIQIPKTSSTSILKLAYKNKLIKKQKGYRHECLAYLENFFDNKLPVYAIVRNPFMHIYSYFFHRIRHNEIVLNNNLSIIKNFENFVKNEVNNVHLRQYDYIKSNKGIKVNIYKFENNNLMDYLVKTYKLKPLQNKNHNINKLKEKNKINIKDFFKSQEIVDLIIKERHLEFKDFGYSTKIEDLK